MNTHQISTAEALRLLGFDCKTWDLGTGDCVTLQITDSAGVTFYVAHGATLQECLARYEEKKQQFKQATT